MPRRAPSLSGIADCAAGRGADHVLGRLVLRCICGGSWGAVRFRQHVVRPRPTRRHDRRVCATSRCPDERGNRPRRWRERSTQRRWRPRNWLTRATSTRRCGSSAGRSSTASPTSGSPASAPRSTPACTTPGQWVPYLRSADDVARAARPRRRGRDRLQHRLGCARGLRRHSMADAGHVVHAVLRGRSREAGSADLRARLRVAGTCRRAMC